MVFCKVPGFLYKREEMYFVWKSGIMEIDEF